MKINMDLIPLQHWQ